MRGSDQQFLLSPHVTINRLTYIKKKNPAHPQILCVNFDKSDSHLLQTQDAHGVCVVFFFLFLQEFIRSRLLPDGPLLMGDQFIINREQV